MCSEDVLRREATTQEKLHKHLPPGDSLVSSLIGQLPYERPIPNQATALAHPQSGNYNPEGSSPIKLLSVCPYFEEGSPYSRITIQTSVYVLQKLILNWATVLEGSSSVEQLSAQLRS